MRVMYTGPRDGMTGRQWVTVNNLIKHWDINEAHHGDCVGGDAQFHDIVASWHGTDIITIHPPLDSKLRAFKVGGLMLPKRDYLVRNHNMVNVCADEFDVVIATPPSIVEIRRSGTWATVRYARKMLRNLVLVFPAGTQKIEPGRFAS